MASSTTASSTASRFKKKGSGKDHGTHVALAEDDELPFDDDEEEEEEHLEHDEAYEAFVQEHEEPGEEDMQEEGNEDDKPVESSVTHEELKEAWAAGWRAKDQVAEKKKWRSFQQGQPSKPMPKQSQERPDPRKQATTCSSCGTRGHWRGDPECPKVKSGEDKPFQPKVKTVKHVNFAQTPQITPDPAEKIPKEVFTVKHVGPQALASHKIHEVNFTFMAQKMSPPKEPPKKGARSSHPPLLLCAECEDRFCSRCGASTVTPMLRRVLRSLNVLSQTMNLQVSSLRSHSMQPRVQPRGMLCLASKVA